MFKTILPFARLSATEIYLWDFPRDDRFTTPPLPFLQVRRRTRATEFAAVYAMVEGTTHGPKGIDYGKIPNTRLVGR